MKKNKKNYDIYSGHSHYTPGVAGMFGLLGWFIVGSIIGSIITVVLKAVAPGLEMEYLQIIAYPFMFVPALIYVGYKSRCNSLFETGYALDSNHFGRTGGPLFALLVILATLVTSFMSEAITSLLPPIPPYLEEALKRLTQGNVWIDFLCVSIMAPIFEEWLCRGMILRGLLNYKHKDKSGQEVNGIKPVWAIVISAVFFAVIHANPWQAVVAFLLGSLFGYVYYKTGSLKLTMLMHFANNTFSLILSQIDSLKEMESWRDVMPATDYWVLFAASALLLGLFILTVSKVQLVRPQGNSDVIELPEP